MHYLLKHRYYLHTSCDVSGAFFACGPIHNNCYEQGMIHSQFPVWRRDAVPLEIFLRVLMNMIDTVQLSMMLSLLSACQI
jgi:hypothetical protein